MVSLPLRLPALASPSLKALWCYQGHPPSACPSGCWVPELAWAAQRPHTPPGMQQLLPLVLLLAFWLFDLATYQKWIEKSCK